jgi:RNA polymerase sigma factor (sigma-70 family)
VDLFHADDSRVIAESVVCPDAFGLIFDRHATVVFRFFERRVGRSSAEDLLGEVFRIAFEKRGGYVPAHDSALPWLFGIGSMLVRKHHRKQTRMLKATARLSCGETDDDGWSDIDRRLDAVAMRPRLAEAMLALSKGDREVIAFAVFEDLSYEEIASTLGLPIGTVRSRLNRARRKLRELFPAGGNRHDARMKPHALDREQAA